MPGTSDREGDNGAPPTSPKAAAKPPRPAAEIGQQLGIKRWLRVTARKALSSPRSQGDSGNAAADAAASALAELLKDVKKIG